MMRPRRLPNERAARNDGQAGPHEQEDANVGEAPAEVADSEDDEEADARERELEQDGLQRAPAKRGHDEGAKAADGAVHGVARRHHDEDEVDLDVEERLADLIGLELGAAHARLADAEPLDGREALHGREEPGGHGGVRDRETGEAEQEREGAGEEVDVLPAREAAAMELRKGVVEGAADDGEEARAGEPPALAEALLALGVVSGHDAHEARGNDALDEAQEEALHEEAPPGGHGCGEHADE